MGEPAIDTTVETAAESAPAAPSLSEQGWLRAARDAFARGGSREQVVQAMTATGVAQATAERLADQARCMVRELVRETALRTMGVGLAWLVGGVAVTWITYNMAEGGGSYIVTWGPIAWGGYTFLRGAWAWFQA
jgi:hypothetical protein